MYGIGLAIAFCIHLVIFVTKLIIVSNDNNTLAVFQKEINSYIILIGYTGEYMFSCFPAAEPLLCGKHWLAQSI